MWPPAAAIQSRFSVVYVASNGCNPVAIFSQLCGFQRQLSSQDFHSSAWPLVVAIQSRSSVSCVASNGSYPIEISVSCVASSGCYPVENFQSAVWPSCCPVVNPLSAVWPPIEIFSQLCGLEWLQSSRESSVSRVASSSCCPAENPLSAEGLWSLLLEPVYPRFSRSNLQKVI